MNDEEDILTGSSATVADDQYEELPDSVQVLEGVAGMVGLACADLDEALGAVALAYAAPPWVRAAHPLNVLLLGLGQHIAQRPRASARSHSRRRTSPGYSVFIISDA
jgi:hypothetical protein